MERVFPIKGVSAYLRGSLGTSWALKFYPGNRSWALCACPLRRKA